MKKTHVHAVIGVAAFVIGGIVARERALEVTEMLENFMSKNKKPSTPEASS